MSWETMLAQEAKVTSIAAFNVSDGMGGFKKNTEVTTESTEDIAMRVATTVERQGVVLEHGIKINQILNVVTCRREAPISRGSELEIDGIIHKVLTVPNANIPGLPLKTCYTTYDEPGSPYE